MITELCVRMFNNPLNSGLLVWCLPLLYPSVYHSLEREVIMETWLYIKEDEFLHCTFSCLVSTLTMMGTYVCGNIIHNNKYDPDPEVSDACSHRPHLIAYSYSWCKLVTSQVTRIHTGTTVNDGDLDNIVITGRQTRMGVDAGAALE
jgi:hypothetical protein